MEICPATFMLHVARTGQEITTSMLSTLRPEPFYGSKHPRSIIALPVLNQGNQVGVILLSSMSNLSTSAQSSSARGVVGCLATFASIAIFNNFFTKRLKQEVEERTRDLTSALAAKTQFLSQCSHELRTPLSSILVRLVFLFCQSLDSHNLTSSSGSCSRIAGDYRSIRCTTRTRSNNHFQRRRSSWTHQQHSRSFPYRVRFGNTRADIFLTSSCRGGCRRSIGCGRLEQGDRLVPYQFFQRGPSWVDRRSI